MPIEWLTSRIGDYTDDAILITEAEPVNAPGPRIVWCNAAFTHMTGYELEDVKGLSPRILQGEDTDRTALDKIRTALETWQKVRAGLKNYRKDGSVSNGIDTVWIDDFKFTPTNTTPTPTPAPSSGGGGSIPLSLLLMLALLSLSRGARLKE